LSSEVLHRAAGLTIAADAPIPGLPAACDDFTPDVTIHLDTAAPWHDMPMALVHSADHVDSDRRPLVTVARNSSGYRFTYADGTSVWIDVEGTQVWCTADPGTAIEDTATYLTGPILGFVLRRRGVISLHASAVEVGAGALVMIGPHGAGKSTAAAALATRGCPLITDDVLHVRRSESSWLAEPFAAGLRLWPEGASLVLGSTIALRALTPTWDKRALDSGSFGVTSAREPVAIRSLVFLEWSESPADSPRLAPIGAAESVVRLATHSSAAHLLDDRDRAREFHAFTNLVGSVRVIRAIAAHRPDAFPEFVEGVHRWALEEGERA
jgi:hypothetical protein